LRIVEERAASGFRAVGYNRTMSESQGTASAATVNDPVCGKAVDPAITMWHMQHEGQRIYFCSLSCALRFKETPDAFVRRTE
jgi:YHS domain-containing protein